MIAGPGSLAAVVARHAPDLMARPGVIGVGEGDRAGRPCIVVFVDRPGVSLPVELEGYPVVARETGRFEARPPR